MKIDISIDDGHISDLRLAKLLKEYGFVGTFYIPNCQVNKTIQMSMKEIKEGIVNLGHELGGHTVSHPMDLKLVPDNQLKFELENNQIFLQRLSGKPVTKFCPPRGRFDDRVVAKIKECGFTEIRTTRVLNTDLPKDLFRVYTTIHMFPREEYNGVHWFEVAKNQLDIAISKGENGYFHLWGHSAELDRLDYWEDFENLLKIIVDKVH